MTDMDRFMDKVSPEPNSGCWLWTASSSAQGYGHFQVNGRLCRAHRVSWELHNGKIPDGMWVLHKCDNPGCVNPDHLFLGTNVDNVADMVAKGRRAKTEGATHWNAKLSERQIRQIRSASGLHKEIAAAFGVSRQHISHIKSGGKWSHLK